MKAYQRRRKNRFERVKDEGGTWQFGEQRDRVLLNYFDNLFTSSNPWGSTIF